MYARAYAYTPANFVQLCQLAKEDAHYERHHDDDVAKTPNIVDGNIQAGWKI